MLTRKQQVQKTWRRVALRLRAPAGTAVPLFILGAQRSGTNMLLDVLQPCPWTECYNETDEEAFDNYVLHPADVVLRLIRRSHARVVVFKPICDSQNARTLLDLHPRARAVWIYRRWPDVVNSALRNFTEHNRYLHYMLHEPRVARWRLQNVDAQCLQLVERFYKQGVSEASARALIWYLRVYQYFQQDLPSDPRTMLLSYEQTVQEPHAHLPRLFAACGLSYEERFARPLFTTSVGRHAAPEIDPEIAALCDEMYARLEAACAASHPPGLPERAMSCVAVR
ncbi:MAG TPA: hypothetical protein PKK06_03185 [Phycisphaerae bacterium]|nr:hypothetical protein [Phycisphaerae bacterium]HNU44689.1 hypothetical protein [Phycisphaerae bacterium]